MFLICKVLGMLPEAYDQFKTNWTMFPKDVRTMEHLTTQLCAHEKLLSSREAERAAGNEALIVQAKRFNSGKQQTPATANAKKNSTAKFSCNYCGKPNHYVRQCRKWIADGRPPKDSKPDDSKPGSSGMNSGKEKSAEMMIVETCAFTSESSGGQHKDDSWYVDNGATSHITHDRQAFQTFERFELGRTVQIANGKTAPAIGKGTVLIEAAINGKYKQHVLTDVWYVPELYKNLFSVLAAQDKLSNSTFKSSAETCTLYNGGGEPIVIGLRKRSGGLFKLAIRIKQRAPEVNAATTTEENLLQLLHERMGHQNK